MPLQNKNIQLMVVFSFLSLVFSIFFYRETKAAFNDPGSWSLFSAYTEGVTNTTGYTKGVFDGRYIYYSPYATSGTPSGQVLRFDSTQNFLNTSAWTLFDTTTIDPMAKGYYGSIFDGTYIYFVPYYNSYNRTPVVARYNTTLPFSSPTSWQAYNPAANGVGTHPHGYTGGAFDGRYIYFAPWRNETIQHGEVLRFDTQGNFTTSSSWSTFDPSSNGVGSRPKGFTDAIFDGKYLYFVPYQNGVNYSGEVLRYNTTQSFNSAASWDTFDPSNQGMSSNLRGFEFGIFDGRYIYFVPLYNQNGYTGEFMRYDTEGSFQNISSWQSFNAATELGNAYRGFVSGYFDGEYVYFAPTENGPPTGAVLRYHTSEPFTSSSSWSVYDPSNNGLGSTARGFVGIMSDGKYLYFIPAYYGAVMRYDPAYTQSIFGKLSLTSETMGASDVGMVFTLTPKTPLPSGSTIEIEIPEAYEGNLSQLTSSDISVLHPAVTGSTASINTSTKKILVSFTSNTPLISAFSITIGDGTPGGLHDLSNPNTAGQYSFPITIQSSLPGVEESETALAFVSARFTVTAVVSEALILHMDSTSLQISADPSIANGVNSSTYSSLSVSSNAQNGYSLYGSLNDGSGNARLTNGTHSITSGLGENTLSFEATNSGYNSSRVVDADSVFQGTPTLLSSHSTTIGHTAPTNIINHTIYYTLNVDYSIPAGNYSGNITYTAIGTF